MAGADNQRRRGSGRQGSTLPDKSDERNLGSAAKHDGRGAPSKKRGQTRFIHCDAEHQCERNGGNKKGERIQYRLFDWAFCHKSGRVCGEGQFTPLTGT